MGRKYMSISIDKQEKLHARKIGIAEKKESLQRDIEYPPIVAQNKAIRTMSRQKQPRCNKRVSVDFVVIEMKRSIT